MTWGDEDSDAVDEMILGQMFAKKIEGKSANKSVKVIPSKTEALLSPSQEKKLTASNDDHH